MMKLGYIVCLYCLKKMGKGLLMHEEKERFTGFYKQTDGWPGA